MALRIYISQEGHFGITISSKVPFLVGVCSLFTSIVLYSPVIPFVNIVITAHGARMGASPLYPYTWTRRTRTLPGDEVAATQRCHPCSLPLALVTLCIPPFPYPLLVVTIQVLPEPPPLGLDRECMGFRRGMGDCKR